MQTSAYATSPLQHGMLVHRFVESARGVDIEQIVYTLPEAVDVATLKRAWDAVAARHDVLRTSFAWDANANPVQHVWDTVSIPFTFEDWGSLDPARRTERLEAFLTADRARGFSMNEAPLFRVALIRTSDDAHVLVWTVHHAIIDGRSFVIVLDELFASYEALRDGSAPLAPAPVQFGAYITWLKDRDPAASQTYWRERLRGFSATTPLPATALAGDIDARAVQRERELRLSEATTSALTRLAGENGVTMTTLLHGAWALLLSRHSSESDVVFGTTRTLRRVPVEGADRIVGPMINTLPLRVEVRTDQPLVPWLQEVRARWNELREHEHTPLALVQSWSEIGAGKQLFESILVYDDLTLDEHLRRKGGAWARRRAALIEQANYALMLSAFGGTELSIKLEYDGRRFDDETIERLAAQFTTLLDAIARDPNQRVGDVPILGDAERDDLLRRWNATDAEYPRDRSLVTLVEAQVARTPDAVAVVCGDARLTYSELDAQANRVANSLRASGVTVGSRVGVSLDRSLALSVGVLAILKAGAAYVPLDLALPHARLRFVMSDARLDALLTQRALHDRVAEIRESDVPIVCIEDAADALAQDGAEPGPDDTAYVIYTSGSTGQPKGVPVTHRALVNLLCSMLREPGFGANDVMLAITTLSFDIAGVELWLPLLAGGRLVIVPHNATRDGRELDRLLRASGVTLMQATPATWRLLLAAGWNGIPGLRMITGGEALLPDLAAQLLARGAELWNMYGPTETTIYSSLQRILPRAPIRLGHPTANTQLYVLDAEGDLAPIGAVGELAIGGDGVSAGYLNRDDLTAERFIVDRFRAVPGARLYRSGDLARRHPDGSLEFLGRRDNQVKIRGFRIELGEIESTLATHSSVEQAVVVVRSEADGEPFLVAYYTRAGGDGAPADQDALRADVRAALPEYMVPAWFVELDALPLTASGKVDRRALPAISNIAPKRTHALVAPRNATEAAVAHLAAEILGREQISVEDDLFDIGLHSLNGMSLLSHLRRKLGVELSIATLFSGRTIAALANAIAQSEHAEGVHIRLRPAGEPVRLSPAQEALWLLHTAGSGSIAYNIPIAMRLHGSLDRIALGIALDALVARHAALRTTFVSRGSTLLQHVEHPARVALRISDLSMLDADERERETGAELRGFARRRFDLERDVLLRGLLLKCGPHEHILALVSHHIVTDGVSFDVLLDELPVLYAAATAGAAADLPMPAIEFADVVQRKSEWLTEARLGDAVSFWSSELAGANADLALPSDFPHSAEPRFDGARLVEVIPSELLEQLRELARHSGVTLYMALLAVYAVLLHRYTQQDEVVIGSPIAARDLFEIERIVGYFANTVPLRVAFDDGLTFAQLLGRVRETCITAYEHQNVPFDAVLARLPGSGGTSNSAFKTIFAMENSYAVRPTFGTLTATPIDVDPRVAKFDLSAWLTEMDDGMHVAFEYRTDVFRPQTVQRLCAHFAELLRQVVADPARRVDALPLLSSDERAYLLHQWNTSDVPYPRDHTLVDLVEAQVARTPSAVAVSAGERALTYAELDERADRLADRLRGSGVTVGTLVGVCLERSVDLTVGLLAILKAGGAYVPLEPTFPPARLAFVVTDADVRVILTERSLRSFVDEIVLYAEGKRAIVSVDDDGSASSDASTVAQPPRKAGAEDLAYVIYTSGSTGLPKGVRIQHRALVNLLLSMQRKPGIFPGDRLLAITTISFDLATPDMWLPLIAGARIVLAPRSAAFDGADIAQRLATSQITFMQATPATWRLLIAAGWRGTPNLTVLCGGEALHRDLADQLLDRADAVWNMYGPTETTVWSALQRVRRDEPIALGRPLANTQLYVLEPGGEPAPLGVVGELFIGGDGVSAGYLNRDELNAERFLRDPFRRARGARLYRTGDLVRRLPNGRLEFAGRRDHQVKIRGFRIELGEIEASLAAHPQVGQAAVLLAEESSGDPFLAAYYTARDGVPATPDALRAHLRASLPEYMIPTRFLVLDALPMTSNRKIDRKALPAPSSVDEVRTRPLVGPRDATEALVVRVAAEILGRDALGVEDNLFEMGLHSLHGMRLLSRLRDMLRVEVPISALFKGPTVAELARALRAAESKPGQVERIAQLVAQVEEMSLEEVRVPR